MSKLVFRSLLLATLITSPVFADEPLSAYNLHGDVVDTHAKPEENFFAVRAPMPSEGRGYFGLNLGVNADSLKPKMTKGANGPEEVSKSRMGYGAGVYGGYGKNFDRFYLGAELSGGYNTLNSNIHMTTFSSKISTSRPFVATLDIMPGYINQQRDFLLYCRLGMGAGLFSFELDDDCDSHSRQVVFGYRAGLGMEYFFVPAFSMRVEYILNSYNAIEKNYTSGGTRYDYELSSPKTHQVNLGFTINF